MPSLKNLIPVLRVKNLSRLIFTKKGRVEVSKVFPRYLKADRKGKVDIICLFPIPFLLEFGIENLTLSELKRVKPYLAGLSFSGTDLRRLETYADYPESIDSVLGEELVDAELLKRMSNESSVTGMFEILATDSRLISEYFSLWFLEKIFPRIKQKELRDFVRALDENHLPLLKFSNETENELENFVKLREILIEYPEIWSLFPTSVKFNRQLVKNYKMVEGLVHENFYKGFLYE